MAARPVIAVTGPRGGIPWAWWATRWQLRQQAMTPRRLHAGSGRLGTDIAGVIIGGGNDIDPGIYGGDVSLSPSVDPERDKYELDVLGEAERRSMPVLGICRGAQLINVYAGGNLIGDLSRHRKLTSNKGTLLPRKQVSIKVDSTLADWLQVTTTRVNSLHHQAVRNTGDGLRVSARDRDNIVQAIESRSGPLRVGVQWHPEYLLFQQDQKRLFASFANACREYQTKSVA